jgi:hypothetical protein
MNQGANWRFVLRAEHREAPLDGQLFNLRYYGGAQGNVLLYHPTSVLKQRPPDSGDEDNVGQEDEQGDGGGDGDSVTIQLPPPGTESLTLFSAKKFLAI